MQENEKLYMQMKAQRARSNVNEEAMFKENQRLLTELVCTRWVQRQAVDQSLVIYDLRWTVIVHMYVGDSS